MASWLDVCRDFVEEQRLTSCESKRPPGTWLRVLEAFACVEPRNDDTVSLLEEEEGERGWARGFEELENEILSWFDESALAALLETEVDGPQAAMFARRVVAVVARLGELGRVEGRLLRVGLLWRLRGIVDCSHAPKALRVRALADFYYSQAGLLYHWRSHASESSPTIEQMVARARWNSVAPGVEHVLLDGLCFDGQLHVNVVRMDPKCVRLGVVDCRLLDCNGTAEPEQHKEPPQFSAVCETAGAVCGVSGGYFLYSEPDIVPPARQFDPVGLLLSSGRLLSPPFFRRAALLADSRGALCIARVGVDRLVVKGVPLHSSARVGDGRHRLELWTRARARNGPPSWSFALRGLRVEAVGKNLPVPLNGAVVELPQELQELDVRVGDMVEIDAPVVDSSGLPAVNGIAGGPLLLENGNFVLDFRKEDFWGTAPPVTFSQDETNDQNMLPRLAVGLDEPGRLLLAAVDGRNFDRALGMTLSATAKLMSVLGCRTAANLDGGSSKRMYVAGRGVVDLTSTNVVSDGQGAESIRPVHTACLLYPAQEKS